MANPDQETPVLLDERPIPKGSLKDVDYDDPDIIASVMAVYDLILQFAAEDRVTATGATAAD